MTATVLSRLEHCVARVADRLTEPESVVAITTEPDPWIALGTEGRRPRWQPASLSSGPAGIALLFAELSHQDGSYRRTAHDYLTLAAGHASRTAEAGLHTGLAGLAFAAQVAAHSAGDYATLLSGLDEQIAAQVAAVLAAEDRRRPSYEGTSFGAYDVVRGLAGIGRYLLVRDQRMADPLREVLTFFVTFAEPVRVAGAERPGWWVRHAPTPGLPAAGGHANFGLAHGLAGPLSLLSLAWRAGHRVPGQDAAIVRMVSWYLEHLGRDDDDPFWPIAVYAGQEPVESVVSPPTWCYGAPGIARAIQLAGLAMDEPRWFEPVRSVLHTVIAWLDQDRHLRESMLCHGWSGLLQTLWRVNAHLGDPLISRAIDDVAARLADAYDPDLPFGFRARRMGASTALDLPGFLEGSAGTALAINTYLTGREPRSGWDAALLLA
jgi:hypothetical protein